MGLQNRFLVLLWYIILPSSRSIILPFEWWDIMLVQKTNSAISMCDVLPPKVILKCIHIHPLWLHCPNTNTWSSNVYWILMVASELVTHHLISLCDISHLKIQVSSDYRKFKQGCPWSQGPNRPNYCQLSSVQHVSNFSPSIACRDLCLILTYDHLKS